jgi:hypothetical protein
MSEEIDANQLAQDEADLEEGFSGKAAAAAIPDAKPTEDVKVEGGSDVVTEEQQFAGMSDSQLRALLAKASEVDSLKEELVDTRNRIHGRFGEVTAKLNELFKQQQTATPAGGKFTADKFKRLSQEYPEIAEAMASDLSDTFAAGSTESAVDIDNKLNQVVNFMRSEYDQKLVAHDQESETRRMDKYRKTWREDLSTPDFTLFKSQLPQEERQAFDASWDADEINDTFKKYDAWKERSVKKSTDLQTQQAAKTKRLEQAIQPRGTSTDHSPSDADALEAGFQSVRGRRL